MKITIQILYTTSWIDVANIVLPNISEYAHRHGYSIDAQCLSENYPSDFGFNKLKLIADKFQRAECDAIWSLDLDVAVTNHKRKIEDYIKTASDFYITKDYNGINAGSFIVLNSYWSETFIEYCLAQQRKVGMHCEQNAIEEYIKNYPKDRKIAILPHPTINSFLYENYPDIPMQEHEAGQWQAGDFLLHLPGVSLEKRIDILKNIPILK
jgi:hypothetical protein